VLVDTSVWIDHFRRKNRTLIELLYNGRVAGHPFITGELSCGSLNNREEIITLIRQLPQLDLISIDEFIYFINSNSLYSRGIGFVDINLIASALIGKTMLWTLDKKLKLIAEELNISYH